MTTTSDPAPATRTRRLSRRRALGAAVGTTAVAGLTGVTGLAAPAQAATTSYTPGSYPSTPVLDAFSLHLANRFSYGVTPALAAEVKAAGGGAAWFSAQLAKAYDGSATNLADYWPDLRRTPDDLNARFRAGSLTQFAVMSAYANRLLVRRMISPRPVLDAMTEFWENHLHVPVASADHTGFRVAYGDVIRAGALGRFDDLLVAAIQHPAMQVYLNGVGSTKTHPNENLGRELLELHTVGVGTYTEDDVKDSARILTGWAVVGNPAMVGYVPANHATGAVTVLGFTDPNAAADGRPVVQRYLRYLAAHPATARRIATKLAVAFVRDDPPASLVSKLADAYISNQTAIQPVLQTLVASPEFAAAAGLKLRDPSADVVAALRLLRTTLVAPKSTSYAANLLAYGAATLGLAPMTWPAPDGSPAVNAAWASPARATGSMQLHTGLANRTAPTTGITYVQPAAWLPAKTIAFRDLVDHLSRSLFQQVSTAAMLQACCEATGVAPTDAITSSHTLVTKKWGLLMTTLLDHPYFYQR